MTTSQKNQAIADKCPGRFKYRGGIGWHFGRDNEDWTRCLNGSIIDDLNAMAVAEATLTNSQHKAFRRHLFQSIEDEHDAGEGENDERYFVSADSHQRADAFGKVMGIL